MALGAEMDQDLACGLYQNYNPLVRFLCYGSFESSKLKIGG